MTDHERADYLAAWVTGAGIGGGCFMLTWILANRVTGMFMSVPAGPITAMTLAVLTGLVTAAWGGWRLSRRFVLPD
jgi:membrane protein implicated in regulation of membrane protease activity